MPTPGWACEPGSPPNWWEIGSASWARWRPSGESLVARLFSLIVVGDLVSVAIAERAGMDPMPVDVIESLKQRLAEEEA